MNVNPNRPSACPNSSDMFALETVVTVPKDEVHATPVTKTLFTVLTEVVPKAELPLKPETDKLLFVISVEVPKAEVLLKPETDKLLFVDKVVVPKAEVPLNPLTEILFTEVVVAVPKLPAANKLETVTLASACITTLKEPKLAVTPPTEAIACALTATTGVPTEPDAGAVIETGILPSP